MKRHLLHVGLLLGLSVSMWGYAEEKGDHRDVAAMAEGEIQLSEPIRNALNREMNEIQSAMVQMLPNIAAGNWHDVAGLAEKMEGSYIMKQALSAQQLEELHHALPADFLALDQKFHEMAGMLSHVAQEGHIELVSFYFYKLTEGCVACHTKYAAKRFPELQKQPHRRH